VVTVRILRLGHRPARDARVTTHVGLAARALGADGIYLATKDPSIVKSIEEVVKRWGGNFSIRDGVQWKSCISRWKEGGGTIVHLIMYGQRLNEVISEIRKKDRILVVVGGEKVPRTLYRLVDYNVSITYQPHSEISSLAVFLDHFFDGIELEKEYPYAEMKITPMKLGKKGKSNA